MADRLMPSPKREDKAVRSRLDTGHLGRWKNIQSRLKARSYAHFPISGASRRNVLWIR